MKKIIIHLFAAIFTLTICVSVTSCGKDEPTIEKPDEPTKPDTPNTPDNPDPDNPNPGDPDSETVMTPLQQKEYLETVALEFMDLIPSEEFRYLGEMGRYITNIYINHYDWENVGDWGKDIFDAAREALGTESFDSETKYWGYYTFTYNYIYTNYKALLMASNFTGHFTAYGGYWIYERANDLQFIFNDQQNQRLILKVETSGETARVHAFDANDWVGSYDDDFGYTHITNEFYDRTACTIAVPEKIVVTLLKGQSALVKTTVNIDLKNLKDEEFDLSTGNVNASVTTELNNGYKLHFTKISYKGNSSKTKVEFEMLKNSKKLIQMAVDADLYDIPSVNVSAFSSETFDIDDYNTDDANAKNPFVKLDILGKVQMQGRLTDVRKYVDYLDMADQNDHNENQFKYYIDQANQFTDINLFYNNKTTKQATIRLEPFKEDGWDNYWTAEPILIFYDGSSYSTFDAFFNDNDFRRTIDAFKSLANAYANIIGERIDW